MASGQMQVIQEKWQGWEKALREEVAPKLREAANQLETNSKLQTEGKWSAESGPQAFAAKYKQYLIEEVAALRAMAKNAENSLRRFKQRWICWRRMRTLLRAGWMGRPRRFKRCISRRPNRPPSTSSTSTRPRRT